MLAPIAPRFLKLLTLGWCLGFLKLHLLHCLEFPCARFKIGNKGVANHRVRQKRFFASPSAILKFCKNSLREAVLPNPAVQGMLRDKAAQHRKSPLCLTMPCHGKRPVQSFRIRTG